MTTRSRLVLASALILAGCGDEDGSADTLAFGDDGSTSQAGGSSVSGAAEDDASDSAEGSAGDGVGDAADDRGTGEGPTGTTSGGGGIDANCQDGVDCPCDRLVDPSDPLYDPDLLFCEDFESVLLNDGGKGWTDAYGSVTNGCSINDENWNTNMSIEGTCETCCLNIVQEGACEASGEDDCVFQGSQALGHRLQPGLTGGIVGSAEFPTSRTFGITYAVKFSSNFVDPSPAQKTNEFGDGLHCILGCSTSNSSGRNHPFQAVMFIDGAANEGNGVVGTHGPNDGFLNFAPAESDYAWRTTHGPGQWVCHQIHYDGWGMPGATVRYWIDGQAAVEVTDLDLSNVAYDPDGIGSFAWNHYYNDGYAGPDVAYRYEDNFVITAGPEPVPCEAIGFSPT